VAWHKDAETHTSDGGWATSNNKGAVWGEKLECLRPLIPDWTVPLDLLAALKDAGEVTA
jgi:hypothetical protein